ncbi:hypothetical protein VTK56DRAFT_5385 [Thermocarpiscus australiensis]
MAATSNSSPSSPSSGTTHNSLSVREPTDSSRSRSPSGRTSSTASRTEASVSGSSSSHRSNHLSSPSVSSQRAGGGFLAFFDRTIAGITEPRVRPRQSLSRLSTGPDVFAGGHGQSSPERGPRNARPSPSHAVPALSTPADGKQPSPNLLVGDPPSQPYSETNPSQPQPTHVSRLDNKMHQTSSRLLRMTDDDRPFTKVRVSLTSLLASLALDLL